MTTDIIMNLPNEASDMSDLSCFFFPRWKQTQAIEYRYKRACIDYWHEPSKEHALLVAAIATEYNDCRYWWQSVKRAAVWLPKKET